MKKINYLILTMSSIVLCFCFLIFSCDTSKKVGEKTFEETTPSSFIVGSNESSIVVSGAATVIAKVTVKLTILHQSTDDLELTVQSPLGTQVLLSDRNRGTDGDSYSDTVFDDSATTSIADLSNFSPFTGTFKPEQLLSTFNGEDANGTWKLLIVDDGNNGSAYRQLSNWSLTISD
jgi:subtilisin-like proprotein convertase family protein